MRAIAIGLLWAGCAPPPAAPLPISHRAAVAPTVPLERLTRFVERHLWVGADRPAAIRTIRELTIVDGRATLVETAWEAAGVTTVAGADRATTWVKTSSEVQTGPAHQVGDHLAVDLEDASSSLWLRCWHRTLVVAPPGARLVPSPGVFTSCYDPGAWSPAATLRVEALACGQGEGLDDGQEAGLDGHENLDETLFRFAAPPGVELVEVSDGCLQSKGLRLAR